MTEDVTILFNDGTMVYATAPSREDPEATHNIFYNIEENAASCDCRGWFLGGRCWHVTKLIAKISNHNPSA